MLVTLRGLRLKIFDRNDKVQTCKFLAFCMCYYKQEMVCNVMLANHLKTGLQCYMWSINYNVIHFCTEMLLNMNQ